ncbi:hypothetical protein FO519_008639 [Halicephalobus sp. NKZ332]|nr:hypothetical protein FO519_008639 [Halicephalobus sp. NKZ332]
MRREISSDDISKDRTVIKQCRLIRFLPALLVLYSVVKEFKIGTPFLYKYQTEFLNYTSETLNGEIYPYFTYTYLLAIVPIFLFTDILLYKPVMYLEIVAQFIYRFTLVFTDSLFSQQLGQAMYAISDASDVAFCSYIYGKFEKNQYEKLTSWTRAAKMASKTGAHFLAQFIILTHIGNYETLNEIAFYVACTTFFFCFIMPRIKWKHLVTKISIEESKGSREPQYPLPASFLEYALYRLRNMKSDFVETYSNSFIRKWSLWWAMTTCMSLQVALYAQSLYGEVQVGNDTPLNAFADAAYTFISAVFILLTNYFPINWDKWGEAALVTGSIYVMYFCYTFYRSFYQVMITIAQWNIAMKMTTDNYGLIFGINSFIALVLQSVLVMIVTDSRGLGMEVRDSFLLYAAIHAVIALMFFASIIFSMFSYCRKKNKVAEKEVKNDFISLP